MSEPVLEIPTGWEERAVDGWEWATLWEAVEEGDHGYSHDRVQQAIDAGIDPRVILDDGLFPGFNLQGDRFSAQIIFIPEMLITARAMKAGLALIRPLLAANDEKPLGTFVMGTVLGDMHDIGQSIVTIMLENAGFNVINLGTDVHPDKFIETAAEENADMIGFSALLSTTVYYQKVTIDEFEKAGHRDKVHILIGGAPTTQEWADECGADGWGRDAMEAVKLARRLITDERGAWA
ncbi:cobalamin-dependent protein [Anderseniella sp. Alg231-50]|uniref:cobalamin-dependent protein n=1 Tax=Anderseniella sp. Alg231-50 TaxID=1922226 RepID=UPI000D55466E